MKVISDDLRFKKLDRVHKWIEYASFDDKTFPLWVPLISYLLFALFVDIRDLFGIEFKAFMSVLSALVIIPLVFWICDLVCLFVCNLYKNRLIKGFSNIESRKQAEDIDKRFKKYIEDKYSK